MIKVYAVASCSSCKKAKDWLKKQKLEFKEVNLLTDNITREDILEILSLTEEGTKEVISTRSRAYNRLITKVENSSINELIELMQNNRSLLRRPLILDEKRLQVGYNEDDIRKFLPREVRKVEIEVAKMNVPHYDFEYQLS